MIQSHWLVRGTTEQTCHYRELGRKIAVALPDHSKLAVIDTESGGFAGFVVNFELALAEANGGASSFVSENRSSDNPPSSLSQSKQLLDQGNVHVLLVQQPNDALLVARNQNWEPDKY